jgi:hypothetical protein
MTELNASTLSQLPPKAAPPYDRSRLKSPPQQLRLLHLICPGGQLTSRTRVNGSKSCPAGRFALRWVCSRGWHRRSQPSTKATFRWLNL